MFTGIIEHQGELKERVAYVGCARVSIQSSLARSLRPGQSIAVNGVCLTVTAQNSETFSADLSRETLERTTLGQLPLPSFVHLERPLTAGDYLGGHWVQGHVDGVARVVAMTPYGDSTEVEIQGPVEWQALLVPKGSITVDGVSLTINRVQGSRVSLMIIPHTWAHTRLGQFHVGQAVNVELDILSKSVHRFMEQTRMREKEMSV